jgi:hypothetical protein
VDLTKTNVNLAREATRKGHRNVGKRDRGGLCDASNCDGVVDVAGSRFVACLLDNVGPVWIVCLCPLGTLALSYRIESHK